LDFAVREKKNGSSHGGRELQIAPDCAAKGMPGAGRGLSTQPDALFLAALAGRRRSTTQPIKDKGQALAPPSSHDALELDAQDVVVVKEIGVNICST